MLHSDVDSVFPCNLDFHDPITALFVCRSPHCKKSCHFFGSAVFIQLQSVWCWCQIEKQHCQAMGNDSFKSPHLTLPRMIRARRSISPPSSKWDFSEQMLPSWASILAPGWLRPSRHCGIALHKERTAISGRKHLKTFRNFTKFQQWWLVWVVTCCHIHGESAFFFAQVRAFACANCSTLQLFLLSKSRQHGWCRIHWSLAGIVVCVCSNRT